MRGRIGMRRSTIREEGREGERERGSDGGREERKTPEEDEKNVAGRKPLHCRS